MYGLISIYNAAFTVSYYNVGMAHRFTHLHTHSHYSLLNALPKIDDLIKATKNDGMDALALTDNGNLYGAIEFYKECKKADIKPIIGVDAYVALRTRHDKEARIDNKRSRLILLAKNETGYKNLIALVTKSHLEGFYYKPRIDHELIEQYHEGLIAILPSFSSEVSLALKRGDTKEAEERCTWYENVFKKDLYLEITHHPEIAGHDELMEAIVALAKKTDTPLVAAHDVYYIEPGDRKARDVLMRIQTSEFGDAGTDGDEDFSFISQKTANEYFKNQPEALENVQKIVDACDLEIEMKWTFPNFIIKSGRTPNEELRHLAYEGLKRRDLELTPEVKKRIEYELDVIKKKDYPTYFLVVEDLLWHAHKHGILTTIRGSVAGSLVTYLIGITNVNPLEYKLPFERFLNLERPSAPDIDMDFADDRRDEMIQYAKDKYGEDKVAQIGTFGTMLARGVVRDVARALGHPYSTGDRIAKLIPLGSQGFPMTIERAFEQTPELKDLYKKDEDVKGIIDIAKEIEGNARHISIHAAGVVIAPKPLIEYVPVQYDPKGGKIVTQYDMHSVGEDGIGLLKFDFLGIKNLAILADAVKRVKKIRGVTIDIENVPLDDKKTFELLSNGETEGLFQLNGSGMTHFLKELKPTSIHDINAMVALYRPGPMETIPEYIRRKHNSRLVSYADPRMKEYLEFSNGVLVYQDDVLLTAIKLAGYSWLEADKLRKAMGKKIPKVMQAEKEKFIKGCIEHGKLEKPLAEKLWKLIEPFAAYGFNKAHAASYGKVAYQTAYMKANFPIIYMSAVLSADAGNVEKVAESINECKRMGIDVLPPDVNESFGPFSVVVKEGEKDCIRFGLHSIKNFGEGIADSIIDERKKNGKYTSLENFLERIQDKNLNRKSLEALIQCGALDSLGDRGAMYANIEVLLQYHREFAGLPEAQDSLFGSLAGTPHSTLTFTEGETITPSKKLAWEKELLGLYVSGHPLDAYRTLLESRASIQKIREGLREGMLGVASGIVEEIRPVVTKRGDRMAFVRVADFTGNIEVVFFPKVFATHQQLLQPEACIAIKGRRSDRNGEISLIAEAVKELGSAK